MRASSVSIRIDLCPEAPYITKALPPLAFPVPFFLIRIKGRQKHRFSVEDGDSVLLLGINSGSNNFYDEVSFLVHERG